MTGWMNAMQFRSSWLLVILAGWALPVSAEPTHVMVRALSADAKFIGDHTGGVEVTLRDATTHQVLTKGMIHGGTGDTDRIMQAPRVRGAMLSDAQTAGFDAVIDIVRPTLVEIEARGPMVQPATAITVRSAVWVIPGQQIVGDGQVLAFPGLLVTPTLTRSPDGSAHIAAKVTMLCGCPITSGGLWDTANYRVEADVIDHGAVVQHVHLSYAGQPSQFAADLRLAGEHGLTVRVVATQSTAPNTGVAELSIP
jgi:hypothetical protein